MIADDYELLAILNEERSEPFENPIACASNDGSESRKVWFPDLGYCRIQDELAPEGRGSADCLYVHSRVMDWLSDIYTDAPWELVVGFHGHSLAHAWLEAEVGGIDWFVDLSQGHGLEKCGRSRDPSNVFWRAMVVTYGITSRFGVSAHQWDWSRDWDHSIWTFTPGPEPGRDYEPTPEDKVVGQTILGVLDRLWGAEERHRLLDDAWQRFEAGFSRADSARSEADA